MDEDAVLFIVEEVCAQSVALDGSEGSVHGSVHD